MSTDTKENRMRHIDNSELADIVRHLDILNGTVEGDDYPEGAVSVGNGSVELISSTTDAVIGWAVRDADSGWQFKAAPSDE